MAKKQALVYLVWDPANRLVHGAHDDKETAEAQVLRNLARGTDAEQWVVLAGTEV